LTAAAPLLAACVRAACVLVAGVLTACVLAACVLIAGVLVAGTAAAGAEVQATESAAPAGGAAVQATGTEVEATDARGVTVRLAAPARRIVALAPSLAELLDAAGAADRLVGVSSYTTLPPAARNLPLVAAPGRVDLERIVSLHPDLVLAWVSGNPPAALERIARLGIAVFGTEPRRLEDIALNLRAIGTLAGTAAAAEVAARRFELELAELPEVRGEPTVFIEIWRTPLMTVDGRNLMSDVVRRCGGRDVFARLPALAAQISPEQLLAVQPEFILTSSDVSAMPPPAGYGLLNAVRDGRIAAIDADTLQRQGPSITAAVRQVCAALGSAFGIR
jgi:iron complex transport system substrate-binding protein